MRKKPRADKKINYSRVSTCKQVSLDRDTKQELLSCLNIDEIDNRNSEKIAVVFSKIEAALGKYEPAFEVFDKQPRPANIHSAVMPVREKAGELAMLFNELNDVVREQLKDAGYEYKDIEAIIRIHNAALKVEKKNNGVESRQSVSRHALKMVVAELQDVFCEHYQSLDFGGEDRARKGFIELAKDSENSLEEFIKLSLKAVNITYPKDLKPYFRK